MGLLEKTICRGRYQSITLTLYPCSGNVFQRHAPGGKALVCREAVLCRWAHVGAKLETKWRPGIRGTRAPLNLPQASEGWGGGVHFEKSGDSPWCDSHLQQAMGPSWIMEVTERERLFVGKMKICLYLVV